MAFRRNEMVDKATRQANRDGVRFSVRPGRAFLIPVGGVMALDGLTGAQVARYIVYLFKQADIFDPW